MKKFKDSACAFLICCIIALLTLFSQEAKAGAREGFALCENVIIPSLLPILILTGIIVKSNCSTVFEALFAPLSEKVLRLPRCCASAVIFGLIGGFPAGAVLTCELYKAKMIDEKTAGEIMRFNFGGGIAFTITALGTICLGSTKTGVILYLSGVLSSLIICVLTSFSREKINISTCTQLKRLPLSDALVESVNTSVNSMLLMCAYIILFSAITSLLPLPEHIYPLLEITNGLCRKSELMPLPYCAFFLSFGGLCIHLQLFGILKQIKMKYTEFFIYRLASSVLSFFITRLYAYLSPQSASVFSNLSGHAVRLNQVNTGLSIIMIVGCAVVIFDIENKKLKLP